MMSLMKASVLVMMILAAVHSAPSPGDVYVVARLPGRGKSLDFPAIMFFSVHFIPCVCLQHQGPTAVVCPLSVPFFDLLMM